MCNCVSGRAYVVHGHSTCVQCVARVSVRATDIERALMCGRVKAVSRAVQSQGVNYTHAPCEHVVGAGCMTVCVCVVACPDLAREGKGASRHSKLA
jgi:hypothetical protein